MEHYDQNEMRKRYRADIRKEVNITREKCSASTS